MGVCEFVRMMMMSPILHVIVGVVVHMIGMVVGKLDVADIVVVVGGGIGGIGIGIGIGGKTPKNDLEQKSIFWSN